MNPRYTGYAFFGRWTKHETLLDPDDVAAGHVVRFRRASADRVVRSRQPAHPKIVEIEDFTQAQLLRRSKSSGGLKTSRKTERTRRTVVQRYLFRGRVRCAICTRKMEGSPRKHAMCYRCPARTLAPGSPVLASHPPAVYLREDSLEKAINGWLNHIFAKQNIDRTVSQLAASQDDDKPTDRESAKKKLANAEAKLSRFQEAIKAGIDPAALVEAVNEAQAERAASRAALENVSGSTGRTVAEIYAMIDSLGDIGAALTGNKPGKLTDLYDAIDLQIRYTHSAHAVDVSIKPVGRVNSVRVRGRSCTLFTRVALPGPA